MKNQLGKARELVLRYRELVHAKNLDGIMDALSDDATMQLPGFPLMKDKKDIRRFYEDSFVAGSFEFQIDINSEKIVSDVIFMNGKMRRIILVDGEPGITDELDFSFILKKDSAGKLKIWQIRVV